MNSLCIHSFFYIFLSGSFLFTILGIFAGAGNPVLLIENSQLDEKNNPIEEPNLRKRITLQYFIAAFIDLCFSLIFLKFIFSQNNSSKNIEINQNYKAINNDLIENIKDDEKRENIGEINTNSINNVDDNNNKGMSENY